MGQSSSQPSKPAGNGEPRIVAYDYCDEQGELLYQVVRFDPKDFRLRRPKAGGGWEWTIKGTRLVPYRLPEVLAADPSRDVLIVEGEKDADRAASIGVVATTCAMGAGKWRPEYSEHFRGRSVYIVPDNDEPGREHANQVARSLCGIANSIKVVELPGLPEKGDLSDWLDQGHTHDDLAALVKAAPEWWPSPGDKQPEPATKPKKMKKKPAPSQATTLVELTVKQGSQLWHTPENIDFITVPVGGHVENWPIKSNAFRRWLQREYFTKTKAAVNAQAIQDAIGVLEGTATRGDLLDRSLIVTLPNIPEDQRRPEGDIWHEFHEARPRLLGVLYDAVSVALRNLPNTKVAKLPRMADFALWATAAEPAIGLKDGEFLAAYAGNRAAGNELALESSPVGKVLLDFVASIGVWTGTASELLTELDQLADDKTKRLKGWPQTGRVLSGVLKRLAPNLRAVDVDVEFGTVGRGREKRRSVTLGRERKISVPSVPNVPTSEKQEFNGDDGVDDGVGGDATGAQDCGVINPCPATAGTQGVDGVDEIPPYSGDTQFDLSPEENAAVEEFLRS